ncbi:MAG: VOC family protein [Vicinamibacterales bacterium]
MNGSDFSGVPNNKSMSMGTVIPVLHYADLPAAVTWLCGAFGFRERLRIGSHRAQIAVGAGSVVAAAGSSVTPDPAGHSVMVRVRDVDEHFARASAFGAETLSSPESFPYGERQYSVRDPGGHIWTFSQTIENVEPSTWGGELVDPKDDGSDEEGARRARTALMRHLLATIAYRTQSAVRGAPESFGRFDAGQQIRTPSELIRHMTSVLGFARSCFGGERQLPEPLADLNAEVLRLHAVLEDLSAHFERGAELAGISEEQLLQGPLSDAMTHAGQIAMLRRLAGSPVRAESFIQAAVDAANVGPNQPEPRPRS